MYVILFLVLTSTFDRPATAHTIPNAYVVGSWRVRPVQAINVKTDVFQISHEGLARISIDT